MKESTTYQMIVEEGEDKYRLKEAREYTLRLGSKRYGEPGALILKKLNSIRSRRKLEEIGLRMFDAASWEEALGGS